MKQNYVKDKTNNEMNAIGTFLSNMGYNVTTATMAGRVNDYEETHSNFEKNVKMSTKKELLELRTVV